MSVGKFAQWFLFFGAISCASTAPQRLSQVKVGMDKAEVLDVAGNPKRVKRQTGGDLWTYLYYVNEQPFEKGIRFEAGQVVEISVEQSPGATSDSGNDVITRDYEKLVEEAKAKKATKSP